jgi:hypothetical protein
MPLSPRHQEVEDRFRDLLSEAGLPEPDEAAQLRRSVVFLWYDTKAFVLVDLEELPEDADPFAGLDPGGLAADILGPGLADPGPLH